MFLCWLGVAAGRVLLVHKDWQARVKRWLLWALITGILAGGLSGFSLNSGLIPITPLSGKHYLRAKEQLKITPVSTATYLVSRLNALLRGPPQRTAEPSSRLQQEANRRWLPRRPKQHLAKRV